MNTFGKAWMLHPALFTLVFGALVCSLLIPRMLRLKAPANYRQFRRRHAKVIRTILEKAQGRLTEEQISNRNISEAKALLQRYGDFGMEWTTVGAVDAVVEAGQGGEVPKLRWEGFSLRPPR
jgi:hypothetical protein